MKCLQGRIPANNNVPFELSHFEAVKILSLIHTSMIELYNELPEGMKYAAGMEIQAINYAINYLGDNNAAS